MLGNGLTSLIAGVIIFVTLVIMGVPYPFLLGLWVALVDLLPLVGGLLAGVPVVIIAAFHSLAGADRDRSSSSSSTSRSRTTSSTR